jgi:hypothetical protein
MYLCIYILYLHTYIHTYIHAFMHTYVLTYTYTHIVGGWVGVRVWVCLQGDDFEVLMKAKWGSGRKSTARAFSSIWMDPMLDGT